jgi:hypothetical protein
MEPGSVSQPEVNLPRLQQKISIHLIHSHPGKAETNNKNITAYKALLGFTPTQTLRLNQSVALRCVRASCASCYSQTRPALMKKRYIF